MVVGWSGCGGQIDGAEDKLTEIKEIPDCYEIAEDPASKCKVSMHLRTDGSYAVRFDDDTVPIILTREDLEKRYPGKPTKDYLTLAWFSMSLLWEHVQKHRFDGGRTN